MGHWEPEDPAFWAAGGAAAARRNLIFSILSEHIGFSIWTMWSVLVLFLGPKYGFKPEDKFLLTIVPALVGSVLRVPYTFAVATFGGRNWAVVSALLLLVPTVATLLVLEPGVSLNTLLLVSALAGVGGGNFASRATTGGYFPRATHSSYDGASAATVVSGPCPVSTRVSGGNANNRVRIESRMVG